MPVVYFLRLRSGTRYVGASLDLEQRLDDHVSGQACRTTQLDPPLALLRIEVCSTFCEARQREAQLKRWSRPKKEALIRGDCENLRMLSRSRFSAGRRACASAATSPSMTRRLSRRFFQRDRVLYLQRVQLFDHAREFFPRRREPIFDMQ